MKKGLRYVAILEGVKGLIALIVGLDVHRIATENIKNFTEELARHLHLNPAGNLVGVINKELSTLTFSNLSLIAIGTLLYSLVRFIEAYGLWREYKWVEWFALASGAIYIPIELYELIINFGLISIIVLSVNIVIVLYLYSVLKSKKSRKNA